MLKALSEEALQIEAKFSHEHLRTFEDGDLIFMEGDDSREMYVVVQGGVVVSKRSGQGEVTLATLHKGEFVGEMSLLDGLQRSAGAAALIETKLIFIPRAPFLELLETNGKLARQIILTLCERLRLANAQFDQAVFHDLRYRLVVLLRQLAMMVGRVDQHVAVVDLDLTQGTLAQMLGASREAVNKQLRALVKEGRIAVDGQRIQVFKGKG